MELLNPEQLRWQVEEWGVGGVLGGHASRASDGRHTATHTLAAWSEIQMSSSVSDLAVSVGATLLPPGGGHYPQFYL